VEAGARFDQEYRFLALVPVERAEKPNATDWI
jgi:hypothetical protein